LVDKSGENQGLLKWDWAAGANLMSMPSWIEDISGFSLGFAGSPSNIPSRWVKGLFCFFMAVSDGVPSFCCLLFAVSEVVV
jgi:hypothetical protein